MATAGDAKSEWSGFDEEAENDKTDEAGVDSDGSEEVERAVKKRNTDSDIKSARERYLERKRRKLEGGEAESEKNSSETTS